MSKTLVGTILTLLVLLTGCMRPQQILRVPYDKTQKEVVWQKAVHTLPVQGYHVTLVDQASGMITTEWRQSVVSFALNDVRERVALTVSTLGEIIVNVSLQCESQLQPRGYRSCGRDAAEQRQREIARAILGPDAIPVSAVESQGGAGGKADGASCYKDSQCASASCVNKNCGPPATPAK